MTQANGVDYSSPHYHGLKDANGVSIVWDPTGISLNPRLDLWNHSPTGFAWGYGGSGPAQLALAILADRLRRLYPYAEADLLATDLHQRFKFKVVANLVTNEWRMYFETIDAWLGQLDPNLAHRLAIVREELAMLKALEETP
jgi:hypothetical protein